jgi:hypothetical protein
MTRRRRRKHEKQLRHRRETGLGHTRLALITGVSAGAALGMTATVQAATYDVTNLDPSGSGSLAAAMAAANNGNAPTKDEIVFQTGLSGQINLGGDLTTVDEPLGIYGNNASVTISGGGAHRIFNVVAGGKLSVDSLTLTNGHPSSGSGGAIANSSGEVGVYNSTVSGSTASDGGGIYSVGGKLVMDDSTVTGNTPDGIRTRFNADGVYISTISGNQGFGLHPSYSTHFYVNDSTIDGNTSDGIYAYNASKAYVTGSAVADSGLADISEIGTTLHAYYSLIENAGGTPFMGTHDITGTDPQLAPLAANGGRTPTNRPSNTSPLLDQSNGAGFDQRHQPRPFDIASIPNAKNGSDIGSVELQAAELVVPPPPASGATTPTRKECKRPKKKGKKSSARASKKCKKKKKK